MCVCIHWCAFICMCVCIIIMTSVDYVTPRITSANQKTLSRDWERWEYWKNIENLSRRQKRSSNVLMHDECVVNCTSTRRRPVCATNGRTYPSRCDVKRIKRCLQTDIEILSKGKCRSHLPPGVAQSGTPSKCLMERQQAQALAHSESPPNSRSTSRSTSRSSYNSIRNTPEQFIPICTPEGYFSEVQCLQTSGTRYCWCVTADGKPIHGSSVQGTEISCHGKNARGSVAGCSPLDRSIFNANIIYLFTQDYQRNHMMPPEEDPHSGSLLQDFPLRPSDSDLNLHSPEKRVIDYKFKDLDSNVDGVLGRQELRSLKGMMKKLSVEPRPCARNFDTYCDTDLDREVTLKEWSLCLGVDINNERRRPTADLPTLNSGRGITTNGHNPSYGLPSLESQIGSLNEGTHSEDQPTGNVNYPSPPHWSDMPGSQIDSPDLYNTQESRGCDEERRRAEQQDREEPAGGTFIPSCRPDGLYEPVQCHKASGQLVCWCVDRQNGQPIIGTTRKDNDLDCTSSTAGTHSGNGTQTVRDQSSQRQQGNNQNRHSYKGCPFRKKVRFLTDVMDAVSKEMVTLENNSTINRNMPDLNPEHSLEERVARWKFYLLDSNTNQNLERREWKPFKKEIRKLFKRKKSLRKCCRNFLQYCDSNGDNLISVLEWVDCVVVADEAFDTLSGMIVQKKNPFSKVLQT